MVPVAGIIIMPLPGLSMLGVITFSLLGGSSFLNKILRLFLWLEYLSGCCFIRTYFLFFLRQSCCSIRGHYEEVFGGVKFARTLLLILGGMIAVTVILGLINWYVGTKILIL